MKPLRTLSKYISETDTKLSLFGYHPLIPKKNGYLIINPGGLNQEVVKYDGYAYNGTILKNVSRGLIGTTPKNHPSGSLVVDLDTHQSNDSLKNFLNKIL